MKTKKLMMVALVSSTLALSGCGAMSTAIKKRNLEVKTQMSETIWLEPASERTVFLQIKNTSDKDMSGLQGKIADAVKAKGYQVVTSPDKAYYWIQANVRKRLVRTVLIFTESSDQLSRATDRVPGLPASPGYVQ